jgi:peroxiredoxin
MIELGELVRRYADFEQKNTRIVAVSVNGPAASQMSQADFPHLTIVADRDRKLVNALGAVHPHAFPDGSDAAASTTILVDPNGTVRWLYRPDRAIAPLSPDELLAAVAQYLPTGR